jgi:hypothetical protein
VIVAACGKHFIAAAQHVLPHDIRRHICIAGLGEIAVRGSANEAAFALRIEPPSGLAIRNDGGNWCARAASLLLLLLLLLAAWCVRLSAALSASSALIAAAPSIVPVIAIALLSPSATATAFTAFTATAFTAFVALLLTLTALGAATRLRIVGRLLLLLCGSAGVVRSVG